MKTLKYPFPRRSSRLRDCKLPHGAAGCKPQEGAKARPAPDKSPRQAATKHDPSVRALYFLALPAVAAANVFLLRRPANAEGLRRQRKTAQALKIFGLRTAAA